MADDFEEEADRQAPRKVKRSPKPSYPDFKETRDGRKQLQCECGSQSWHLWDDKIASCATCGLPETAVSFHLVDDEQAELLQEALMA